MTCLSDPAQYRGNLYCYQTRPYTTPSSSPDGNRHQEQISPTTNDQPNYNPNPMEAINKACPPGSEQSFPITYPFENDVPKSNLISTILQN